MKDGLRELHSKATVCDVKKAVDKNSFHILTDTEGFGRSGDSGTGTGAGSLLASQARLDVLVDLIFTGTLNSVKQCV